MAWVVLLRGANVGTHRRFLPSEFVRSKRLVEFDLVNLGAAGTFVSRTSVAERRLRRAVTAELPFQADITICPGTEILDLLKGDPFGTVPPAAKPCVSVLAADPVRTPDFPAYVPDPRAWEVTLISARGRYVFSLYRRLNGRLTYPNPIVELEFGVGATTRGWATFLALGKLLEGR